MKTGRITALRLRPQVMAQAMAQVRRQEQEQSPALLPVLQPLHRPAHALALAPASTQALFPAHARALVPARARALGLAIAAAFTVTAAAAAAPGSTATVNDAINRAKPTVRPHTSTAPSTASPAAPSSRQSTSPASTRSSTRSPPRATVQATSTRRAVHALTPVMAQCFEWASRRHGMSTHLLHAIALQESGLNPRAVNRNTNGSTDIGLMQINSSWAPVLARYGIRTEDLWDPCTNILVGAWILGDNLARLGPTVEALGAYNARDPIKRAAYARQVLQRLHQLSPPRTLAPAAYADTSSASVATSVTTAATASVTAATASATASATVPATASVTPQAGASAATFRTSP